MWKQERKDVPYFLFDSGPMGKTTPQMWAIYRINEFGCARFQNATHGRMSQYRDREGEAEGAWRERENMFLFKDMLRRPCKLLEKSERNSAADTVDLKAKFLS